MQGCNLAKKKEKGESDIQSDIFPHALYLVWGNWVNEILTVFLWVNALPNIKRNNVCKER